MIIGITGALGSGKSSVSKMLAYFGGKVIDVDRLCHSLIEPNKKAYKKVVKYFGKDILNSDKSIDRNKLADIVFKEKGELKQLNSIVHPEAVKEITKLIKRHKNIIIDAAVLIESGLYKKMDAVILVISDENKQINRVIRSKERSRNDAIRRIGMQMPVRKQKPFADFIIDNSGSRKKTFIQVKKIWIILNGGKTWL